MVRLERERLTWWAYGVVASFALILNGLGPVLLDVREELGLSRTVAGLHSTGLAAGVLLAGAAGERLRLRLGWTAIYWLGNALIVAGVLALAAGRAPAVTIPAALLIGFAGTLLLVMAPALLKDRHGPASGTAVAEAHATASVLGIAAPMAVGASLAVFESWLPAFLLVGLAVLPALGLLAPELPAGTSEGGPSRPAGRLPRAYWPWWTALLFAVAAEFAVILWAADDAHSRLGLSVGAAALAPSAFLAGMGMSRALGARFVGARPSHSLYTAAAVVATGGFALYHGTDAIAPSIAGLVVVGLGIGLLFPLSLATAMAVSPGVEAQASTRSAVASGVAIGTGPLLLGALADASSISTAAWIVPGLLACGIAAAWMSRRGGVSGR
jgi:predicted MFS family arabinose efflux permease